MTEGWVADLPEAVQSWDEVKNSESPDKFWKQMEDMRSYVGRSIQVPTEDASPDQISQFHDKLLAKVPGLLPRPDKENQESLDKFFAAIGRPEKPDGYEIPEFETHDIEMSDEPIKKLIPIAHKYGLTQDQFAGIIKEVSESNVAEALKANTEQKEDNTKLRNEWGLAYDTNVGRIVNILENTGAPEYIINQVKNHTMDSASMLWLDGIAKSYKSEGLNLNKDKSNSLSMTPVEAKQRITEIMNNKEHDFWHPEKLGHRDAKDHMRELYKMASVGEGASGGSGVVGAGGGVSFAQ